MREQPWRSFVLLFSIANLKLRAHYFDRSGMIISELIQINPNPVRFVDVLNSVTLSDLSSPTSVSIPPFMFVMNSTPLLSIDYQL
ncbi:hypothetical protein M405DRAFT_173064 [Rhizopogon salebrosus TDB-379]|nr:hypothetical protein M405DRAFT_173064 [Rhizopogon salebrosus TDB-379]